MLRLAVLMWALVGTTLAGSFILAVVSVPDLAAQGMRLVLLAGIAGFVAAIPLGLLVARGIVGGTHPA